MSPDVMTVGEVAKLMRVSPKTVYCLAARGKLPGRRVGRVRCFPREAITAYLQTDKSRPPVNGS